MKKKIALMFVLGLTLACNKSGEKHHLKKTDSISLRNSKKIRNDVTKEKILKQKNDKILQILKNKDYKSFTSLIHPEKGIRFSMYALIDIKNDKHFSRENFEKHQNSGELFIWGIKNGSGDLYKVKINDYLNEWVYSKDFINSQYSLNKFSGKTNTNLKNLYPKNDFTENHFWGTEKYGDIGWRKIWFVFEKFQDKYYLIAVINDQWAI
ncbi:hypothetical protein [Elizabethkingia anophelis]|uniref:Lipoprotein n=1 Tax=Elizabethkingia anophelis TaxID=1117645 RepID=A0AAU8UV97_9FLAO|nr:hypothetical protein [Elizabethkingia anophelis]AQX02186.1 hypothetical protein BBD32_12265 [Elizabethkingia anophelis]OPB60439.1 hypothetical protein BAY11_17835 [Elizabethkingia anophelis]